MLKRDKQYSGICFEKNYEYFNKKNGVENDNHTEVAK